MDKIVREWVEISEYDLETAQAVLKARRYLYVAFLCQQAVEKILKAIYVRKKKCLPPRTHNLLYLAEQLKLDISLKDLELFSLLTQFYFENRYPGERVRLAREMNKNKAAEILKDARRVYRCLREKLQ